MDLDGESTIGVWSDLYGPDTRAALLTLQNDDLPVRYLEGPGIPDQYKYRSVAGEPVPMTVLAEMERLPKMPWNVRDRMLEEMGSLQGACPGRSGRRRNSTACFRSKA